MGGSLATGRPTMADLFLKSARRSIQDKSKFNSKPGQHGRTSGQRTSDFGLQLREKQKVKRIYGVLENTASQPRNGAGMDGPFRKQEKEHGPERGASTPNRTEHGRSTSGSSALDSPARLHQY